MKRILGTIVLLALLLTVGAYSSLAAGVEIKHMIRADYGGVLEGLAATFEAQHPGVKIVFEGPYSDSVYPDKLAALIAAGQPPDVVDLFYQLAVPFRDAGLFEDLLPWFENDPEVDLGAFAGPAITGATHPEHGMWGFPINMYILHPVYNETAFLQAGLTLPRDDPDNWTWDTLPDYGQKLTQIAADGTIEKIGILTKPNYGRSYHFIYQAGGDFWNPTSDPWQSLWLTEPVREGMSYWIELYNRGVALDAGVTPGTPSFLSGNAGMDLDQGSIYISTLVKQDLPWDWGLSLWPTGPVSNAASLGSAHWQMLASSDNKELAWEWLKFVLYSEEGAKVMMRATGRHSAVMHHNDLWIDLFEGYQDRLLPMYEIVSNPANVETTVNQLPFWGELDTAFRLEMRKVIRNEQPLESALIQLDHFTTTQIERYMAGK